MKFNDFLLEQKEKHAVMAFGRMNPPTAGHEKLVNKVQEIAKSVGGTAHIVVSHSQDPKKNPLTAAQKIKHAKRAFPGVNISASDKDAPNFLAQASKFHKAGVTHFHMVGGSDRVEEYHKLLHKYNGVKGPHGYFKFKHIEVHSAGDRDPDSEGVEGMSASKMREHAQNGNFKEFRKGVPSKMTDAHAKELYNHVRRGMGINEDINLDFQQLLVEGVHDQSIFKAVFLAGGPGSGKDYVLDNTLDGHGLTEINSDKALEFLMDKKGLDKTMPASEKEKRDDVRNHAKTMTELRQRLALLGRNGLIINGTGDDIQKISKIKERLEEIGYDTAMIMVNTDNEVSAQRNIERGQRGGRTVPENVRREKWESVQNARPELAKLFGDKYFEYDNSEDLRQADPETVKAKKDEMMEIFKAMREFVSTPPENETASMWVAHQMSEKDTLPIPEDGAEQTPHPESGAAEEAKKLGLQYYGFGRYGKNGKVTYRSVHDKLVEVGPKTPQETKTVNEEFETFLNESYSFSDSGALNLLLLGNDVVETNLMFNGENDTYDFAEEKKVKLLRDKNGKVKTFMLRRAAAKEAHSNVNASVMRYKNGYVIKLTEENENVQSNQKSIGSWFKESRTTTRSALQSGDTSTTTGPGILTEGTCSGAYNEEAGCQQSGTKENHKITLNQIRAKQKETRQNHQESIDKGIETGLSMATSGENLGRASGEKISLKKHGRASITETIGAGGEDATSNSDNNELELKRKGINLKSFKANRSISS